MPARQQLPKNPDPERYIQVTTKEGKFWRLKRGLGKTAQLNDTLKKNTSIMSVCSPAAKRIISTLRPYTQHLSMGRIQARLTTLLRTTYKSTGQLKLSVMKGMDLQPEHLFSSLASCSYHCGRTGEEISMDVHPFPGCVKRLNGIVTDYYFDAILMYGHLDEDYQLRVDMQTSEPYTFDVQESNPCSFSFAIPTVTTPFVLFLKVSCLEGKEMAITSRHYGMKVVLVG